MGTGEKNYKIFVDGKEITGLCDSEYSVSFEAEGRLPETISTDVVLTTKHGDIKFTGTFSMDEYGKLCDIYEKIMLSRGDTKCDTK